MQIFWSVLIYLDLSLQWTDHAPLITSISHTYFNIFSFLSNPLNSLISRIDLSWSVPPTDRSWTSDQFDVTHIFVSIFIPLPQILWYHANLLIYLDLSLQWTDHAPLITSISHTYFNIFSFLSNPLNSLISRIDLSWSVPPTDRSWTSDQFDVTHIFQSNLWGLIW